MDKSFICLVSCKPYDDLQEVIEGIKLLKEGESNSLLIEPYLALADFDQLSDEERGRTPDIRFGTSVVCYNGGSSFAESVESQILKDKNAQFVFVGDGENRSIQQKLKSSVQAGLPVILGIRGQDSIEPLKEQLESYFGELSENERAEVTLVYQPAPVKSKQDEEKEIRSTLERCRRILEEIGGESFAEHVKILYAISKYTPELLKSCLKDQIDGVCIYPKILPKRGLDESVQEPAPVIVEEEPEEAIVEPVIEKSAPIVAKNEVKTSEHLLTGKVEGTCLIYCHPYENLSKIMRELQSLTTNAVDCLFALPFTSLEEAAGSNGVECGVWGLSLSNAGHLSYDVHFEMIKESHASFIVIGDRFRRDILNVQGDAINQQMIKAIEKGVKPLLGVTRTRDIKEQLEKALFGIDASEAANIGFIFYGGHFGSDLNQDAEKIENEVGLFRQAIADLYDEETARLVKVILEISHFSEDPFVYLTHRLINGISLSASAIKQDSMSKIPPSLQEVQEAVLEEEQVLEEEVPEKEEITEPQITDEEVEVIEEIPEQEEVVEEPVEEVVKQEIGEELEIEQVERPVGTVKAVVGASVEMSEEEMADWAEANPVQGTGEKVDVEYEEVERSEVPSTSEIEESPDPVIEDEKIEEVASTLQYEAKTVEEGLQLVKLTVDECAERLASKHFQETYIPSEMDLESPDVKLERMKIAYRQKYEDFRNHAAHGWDILFKEMEHNQVPERDEIVNALDLPLEKIMQFTDVKGLSAELDKDEGKVWYEVIGLTKEQMTKLYETARVLFEKKRYKDAADAFFTLISLNPKEYGMWFGYGMAKKLEKDNLELALDAFSVANTLLPGKPEPFIHAAECYIELGNRSEAERCLTHGKELIGEDNQYLKEWAELLEEKL